MKNIRNIGRYIFGAGAAAQVASLVDARRAVAPGPAVFVIDEFFESRAGALPDFQPRAGDVVRYVSTTKEPTTAGIDALMADLRAQGVTAPCAIVGVGGGITLDTAKAIANLFTNPGRAAQYQIAKAKLKILELEN